VPFKVPARRAMFKKKRRKKKKKKKRKKTLKSFRVYLLQVYIKLIALALHTSAKKKPEGKFMEAKGY
jgi:hypothetical protein